MKVCVIMPAYNEGRSVGKVVAGVRQCVPQADVVVIDDGSVDDTARAAALGGAKVLSLPFNLGIGGAVQTGLKYARRGNYDAVVEIDADGQHDPIHAQTLIDTLEPGRVDMVIGSRFVARTNYRPSWLRLTGIRIFSQLIKLVTGRKIYDSTSGFRAYSSSAVDFLSRRYPADFPEPESIVMLLNAGFGIKETSISMGTRKAGRSVVGKSDFSYRAAYFVLSNAIAILVSGLKERKNTVKLYGTD